MRENPSHGRILYNLISNGERPICFPLEIAFTYFKLREKDQTKTLDNNVMLQLLEGREDTDEWIGIRSIVTQCSGRWVVNELLTIEAIGNVIAISMASSAIYKIADLGFSFLRRWLMNMAI